MAAVCARQRALGGTASSTDDGGAQMPRPRHQHAADATGRSMRQQNGAGFDGLGQVQQVVGGHALEHECGGGIVGDVLR